MAVDPTSGAGYPQGAKLPSSHMTTIATQQPDLVDGVNPTGPYPANLTFSGALTCTGATLNASAVGTTTLGGVLNATLTGGTVDAAATTTTLGVVNQAKLMTMSTTESGIAYRTGTLGDADADLSILVDEYRVTIVPTTIKTLTLLETSAPIPADGQRIRVISTLTPGVANYNIQRETGPTAIATILAGGRAFFEFTFHAATGLWYVSMMGGANATMADHT